MEAQRMANLNSTPKANCSLYLALDRVADLKFFPKITDTMLASPLAKVVLKAELQSLIAVPDEEARLILFIDFAARCISAGQKMRSKKPRYEELIQL
jgi:hypothetical protein